MRCWRRGRDWAKILQPIHDKSERAFQPYWSCTNKLFAYLQRRSRLAKPPRGLERHSDRLAWCGYAMLQSSNTGAVRVTGKAALFGAREIVVVTRGLLLGLPRGRRLFSVPITTCRSCSHVARFARGTIVASSSVPCLRTVCVRGKVWIRYVGVCKQGEVLAEALDCHSQGVLCSYLPTRLVRPGHAPASSRSFASASPQMLIRQSYFMDRMRIMRNLQRFQQWLAKCDSQST
jgi:hypothetical protein